MTASCIYEGTIRHRRLGPRREFSHRLALAYLDLDELPGLLDGRLIARRPRLVRFRRRDYLGDPAVPLCRAGLDVVDDRTGARPEGPIRLLTQLRSFGHCFNPVSFYYCIEPGGEGVQALVAEVTSTPWGERHAYVVGGGQARSPVLDGQFDATLALHRRELTRASLAGITARYSFATVRVLALIYAHALGLKCAGVPVHRNSHARPA